MPVNVFGIPSRLEAQYTTNVAVGKAFQDNKVKVDLLRDPKKSDVESLDWTCNGEKILVCSRDGFLKMWRSDRLMEERVWAGAWTSVEAHASDSNLFAAVSWDGKLKIVDIRSPQGVSGPDIDLKKSQSNGDKCDKLLNVTWRLDGKSLAIISRSDFIHSYNITDGSIESLQPGCEVYGAVFDSNNRLWVAAGGTPGKIQVYPHIDSETAPVMDLVAHSHVTACITRSRDHKYIVSGGSDALVALWDSQSAACLRTFPSSLAPVTCVSTNFDNTLIAWGSGAIGNRDGESVLSLAGLETGIHCYSYQVGAPVSRVKWHPTANILAFSMQQSPSADSNVNILSFPSSD